MHARRASTRHPLLLILLRLLAGFGALAASARDARASGGGVATDTAAFVGLAVSGPLDTPTEVRSLVDFLRAFGEPSLALANPYLAPSVAAFFFQGGRVAVIVRVAEDSDAAYIGVRAARGGLATGLQALRDVDGVSLVCVPGVSSPAVQDALIAHAEEMGDRFSILDPPRDAALAVIRAVRARLGSPLGFAALYYPWVRAVLPGFGGPEGGNELVLPPSGFVAGLYAKTDLERGVWVAPVGRILGAAGAVTPVGAADGDDLNSLGIDVLREFADHDLRLWGARTIATDSEYKYVNVRRFLLFLEESLHESLAWAVFEPNDEPLWARMRGDVESCLTVQWRNGALQGARPEEAFFVRVDRSTMTQKDIDEGRTVILLGVATLRPAEFTLLRLVFDRSAPQDRFIRGDANADGLVNIADPIRVLGYLFSGAPPPPCPRAADAADEGTVTLASAVYSLVFLFSGGRAIPPPFPGCGVDPTPDGLGECSPAGSGCP